MAGLIESGGDVPGYSVPVHRALTEHILLGGAARARLGGEHEHVVAHAPAAVAAQVARQPAAHIVTASLVRTKSVAPRRSDAVSSPPNAASA